MTSLRRVLVKPKVLPQRHISTCSSRRSSTSPQRFNAAAQEAPSTPKPFSQIPGPLALPMLRHSVHVLPRIGSFHHTVGLGLLEGLRDRYGDLVRLAKASRTRPVLYVFDPEIMRQVYESGVTEPPCWHQSPLRQQRKQTASKCPVRREDTKAIWAAIRALLLDGRLLQHYEEAFNDIASDVTRRLGDLRLAENALNEELETEMFRWATECIGMMVFGIRLGCLDGATHVPDDENRKPLKNPMDEDTLHRCSLSKRPLGELSPAELLVRTSKEIADHNYMVRSEDTLRNDSDVFNNAIKAYEKHFNITKHFLDQAMEQLKTDIKKEQVLLDKLRPLDTRIPTIAADLLLSGVDPLTQSAIGMLYHLSLNPAQQQRAHDEILWSSASEEAGAGTPELPYIAACAREVLRLQPATGGVVRRSREALVLGGYEVPEGVDIVLAHGVTSKSDKQWGRAKAFIPERWCDAGWQPLKSSRAHPLASLPFGESCPATGIATSMLASLASRLLFKYRLEWHGPAPKLVTAGVNELQPPFYFVLEKAA